MITRTRYRLRPAVFLACALGLLPGTVAARTLAEVKALGALSVCANRDALPYASDNQDMPGFQIELARHLASALGVALNIEWILPRRRANVVNCDMLLDTYNDPAAHEGKLLLSRPYQRSGLALALRRDAPAITHYREVGKDRKIGVMINSVASETLGKAGIATSPYAFEADMIADVRNGELYGAALSAASISYYVLRNPDSGLRVEYAFDESDGLTWQVAVGLRKADQALVDAVNTALERLLSDGTLADIYSRYGVQHRRP